MTPLIREHNVLFLKIFRLKFVNKCLHVAKPLAIKIVEQNIILM